MLSLNRYHDYIPQFEAIVLLDSYITESIIYLSKMLKENCLL